MLKVHIWPCFTIDTTQNDFLAMSNNLYDQMESIDRHESRKDSLIKENSKFGYFWHFLATFGIVKGFLITLPTFDDLKYAENMWHVRVHLMKLKITWPNMVIFHILKIC